MLQSNHKDLKLCHEFWAWKKTKHRSRALVLWGYAQDVRKGFDTRKNSDEVSAYGLGRKPDGPHSRETPDHLDAIEPVGQDSRCSTRRMPLLSGY